MDNGVVDSRRFRDQVTGCWMGKSCGGTLGAPLEETYGKAEPFGISWYPKLDPQGMPNDDLELQLIWLKALEECGLDLTAADLARYWLEYVAYNFDEYGLHKTNLRLGLLPPVSGAYNNWFKDCMGCPIRSEIWACIAPGVPRRAVRFAYEDAICDHAGGESVFGEFFNTAMESAAFIESDLRRLIEIGRTYVPDGTMTALAIDTALRAFDEGCEWEEARKRVLEATPSPIAQYSPINMGFQVIGLLNGKDFGNTLCLAVNCGYDTDCTAATVGSILGIVNGLSGLPERWTKPLGMDIVTSEINGGLVNVSSGPNPVPHTVAELTDRIIAITRKVMAQEKISAERLEADEGVFDLLRRPVTSVVFRGPAIDVAIDYGTDPVIVPDVKRAIRAHVRNNTRGPAALECRLRVPDGWSSEPAQHSIEIPAAGKCAVEWDVAAAAECIGNTNRLALEVSSRDTIGGEAVPVTLVGARAFMVSGPHSDSGAELPPADGAGEWRVMYGTGNGLPEKALTGNGTVFLKTFLHAGISKVVRIGLPADVPTRVWLNREQIIDCPEARVFRPNYGGDGKSYAEAQLREGWNEICIRLTTGNAAASAHLTLSESRELQNPGFIDAVWTRLPVQAKALI